jgi:hypothetical protein
MADFVTAMAIGYRPTIDGILGYVGTVNVDQRKLPEAV